jgi:hypothetical protein
MSHIVTVTTIIRNPLAVAAACTRLGLAPPVPGMAQLYSGQASGLIVQLPGWTYPAVIDTTSGGSPTTTTTEHGARRPSWTGFCRRMPLNFAAWKRARRAIRSPSRPCRMAASSSTLSREEVDMTAPRRRLVRVAAPNPPRPQPAPRLSRLRSRLEAERTALARWQSRLRRAFNAVEKFQRSIQRIERQIARLEE